MLTAARDVALAVGVLLPAGALAADPATLNVDFFASFQNAQMFPVPATISLRGEVLGTALIGPLPASATFSSTSTRNFTGSAFYANEANFSRGLLNPTFTGPITHPLSLSSLFVASSFLEMGFDVSSINGAVYTYRLRVSGGTFDASHSSFTGGMSGNATLDIPGTASRTGSATYLGALALAAPIPEPSTGLLALAGAAAMLRVLGERWRSGQRLSS